MDNMHEVNLSKEELDRMSIGLEDFIKTLVNSYNSWDKVCQAKEELLAIDSYAGRIIHCHNVVDDLMKNTLIALGHKDHYVSKLKFAGKLKKLPKEGKLFCCLIPGIRQFNHIRNHVAHNMSYQLTKEEMSEIDIYLTFFKIANPDELTVEERIHKFTFMCIKLFSVTSVEVKNNWDEFRKQYPVFIKEMAELGKKVKLGPFK